MATLSPEKPAIPPEMAGTPHWRLIENIVASAALQKSARLRDLLLYLAERTLSGHTSELTEQQIGQVVFSKPTGYSPAEDSSVRVHVRQLRLKLHEYFDKEARDSAVLVEIPKGSYRLVFHAAEATTVPAVPEFIAPQAVPARQASLVTIPWALSLCLAVLCAWLVFHPRPAALSSPPWPLSAVFGEGHQTRIVVADANYGILRLLSGRPLSLAEYLSPGSYRKLAISDPTYRETRLLDYLDHSVLTSYADLAVVTNVVQLAASGRDALSVRSAKELRMRDLDEGHYILVGSPASNPWVSFFENRLNFREETGLAGQSANRFRNLKPQGHEPAVWEGLQSTGVTGDDYASIALLVREKRRGNVLILQECPQEGTEAAGRFLLDEANRKRLRAAVGDTSQSFEVLLRVTTINGTPEVTTIVASRFGSR